MHWYALYCRSNTEKLVGLKLADAGIEKRSVCERTLVAAEVPDDALAGLLASMENRFRIWTGNVDLLDMASTLEPGAYRQYISLAREWRRRQRLTCKTDSAKS